MFGFFYDPILDAIKRIERKVDLLLYQSGKEEFAMSALQDALDALTTQVSENTSLEQSAITMIQGLAQQIAQAADDPAEVAALSAHLKESADALAAAITANTPAAPPTP